MASRLASTALAVLLLSSTLATASVLQNCVSGKICYSVAVPESSSASGSGDIYMQLQAPTTNTWAALGQGSSMSGAHIFVMYADGTGNVTVSPRTSTGHTQPKQDSATQVTLLEGSGVDNATGLMVANIKCANCQSWSSGTGTMSLNGSSTSWIAAWKSGAALDSASLSATIGQHASDGFSQFTFDLSQATIQQDANPFAGAAAVSTSSSSSSSASTVNLPAIIAVHGIMMAALFVVMFPTAALFMPILGKWVVHAAFQMFNFVIMWVGYGLGVYAANGLGIGLKAAHTQIGTAVCWAMAIQPILGWLHHRYYLKHNTRGAISHGHIWYGRALMLFGLINVGLGLQLVGGSTMLMTLFAIMAAVVGAFYISIKLFKLMIKRNAAQSEEVQIRRIPSIVKDPRWDGSINEVEMTRYGISRGQGVTVKRI